MKVLIIGFGSIAKKHQQALLQIDPSAKIVALRSRFNAEPVNNVLSVYSRKELQKYAPYDFVLISNPTFKHAETIEQVLDLNCPLFIEKPLFHSLHAASVIDKISASGNLTYVACNLRFLDSLIYLKNILLPNIVINEVNVYCGSFLPEWRSGVDYSKSYSAHEDQGGGVHLDLIHELDYVYWLFGNPDHVHLYKSSKSSLDIDAIDYANYLLEYHRFAVNVVLNYFRRDKKRTIELICADKTYTVDLFSNKIYTTQEVVFESKQIIIDTYKEQLEYFIDKAVNSKKKKEKIMNNIIEAYEVLKICLQ